MKRRFLFCIDPNKILMMSLPGVLHLKVLFCYLNWAVFVYYLLLELLLTFAKILTVKNWCLLL